QRPHRAEHDLARLGREGGVRGSRRPRPRPPGAARPLRTRQPPGSRHRRSLSDGGRRRTTRLAGEPPPRAPLDAAAGSPRPRPGAGPQTTPQPARRVDVLRRLLAVGYWLLALFF